MHCNGHSPYTGEATAIGALYSEAAAKIAVLAKTTRKAMIGFLVLGYASMGQAVGDKAAFLRQKFPKFVLRFLLISILATGAVFNRKSNSAAWRVVAPGCVRLPSGPSANY